MKSWFRKKDKGMTEQVASAQGDAEQVRAKLASTEQDIARAETDLRAVSLQAALSEDPDAGHDTIARLNQLRGKRELLLHALKAAEQAERDRLADLHAREFAARKRSLSQRTGQLQRDSAEVADALKQLDKAIDRFTSTGSSILPLLPQQLQSDARPFHAMLSAVLLRDFVTLERRRLGDLTAKPARLGNYLQVEDSRTGQIKPLTQHIAELVSTIKTQFDSFGPHATCGLTAANPVPLPVQAVQAVPVQEPVPVPEETQFCGQAASLADVLAEQELAAAFGGSGSEQDQSGQAASERSFEQ
jgi:hypothetical protein